MQKTKFISQKKYLQGLIFSGNAKKTHIDQRIIQSSSGGTVPQNPRMYLEQTTLVQLFSLCLYSSKQAIIFS